MTVSDPGRLFADFGSLIGIPTLCLDERGSCSLVFDQKYRVTLALDSARGRGSGWSGRFVAQRTTACRHRRHSRHEGRLDRT